ncbi:DUF2339 domain-containing protein [Ureibacillus sp. GCM10028918]|uniref:DUF2339 domain-containing protein n=1 Tax=Ureibacillus sp. GCM10028918 TaxID=3273429 RepID=UPI003611ABEB
MENETDKRIERLEGEVRALRLELDELKGVKSSSVKKVEIQKDLPLKRNSDEEESHLVKLNKAAKTKDSIIKVPIDKNEPEIKTLIPQKQRSFEEIILWLLPKIFMIILVLGVLWGLKVISDFGLFTNALKIVLAYCLSIGLIILAMFMDIKRPESAQIFNIVLYGGAFIIGILTTAAGAILYEVLGLYFALLLALVYIAYGIAICYVKKNEVLSIFVIFTSLLLPYLLEYMNFNGIIILLYVLLVFGCMQIVFIKHIQSVAMYISYFFSIIAVQVIWSLNDDNAGMYILSHILLNVILLLVWWHLYKPFSKWRAIHGGLLFILSGLTVLMVNIMIDASSLPLLLFAFIYGSFAFWANRRNESRVVDIAGTLSLLTLFNLVMEIEAIDHLEMVLLPLSAFLGLMLALKLNAKLMKITYNLLFIFFVFIHLIVDEIEPFWTLEHLNYLFIFIYLMALLLYLRNQSKVELSEDGKATMNFSLDIFPIFPVSYFLYYVFIFDFTYLSMSNHLYLTALVIATFMLISLFVPEKLIGRVLRYILIFAFLLMYFNLLPNHFVDGFDIWLNLIIRAIYVCSIIAIVGDIYMKGYLYRTWISRLKLDVDSLIAVGIVGAMLLVYSILSQVLFDGIVNYFLVVTGKTLLLFITASISLWMSTTGQLKAVKVVGYSILAIAIIKLVFYDLASLNLIIRALLFMMIGGIGLFLSNRLLSNNAKEK